MLLPSLMLLLALLAQPVCLLYTRTVMQAAAAETVRVAATSSTSGGTGEQAVRAYCLRRLAAVPEASPFHVGGEGDWQITVEGCEGSDSVSVEVVGHARPLPLMGVLASACGESDGEGVVLRVRVEERVRPQWVEGSYGDWVSMWDK